MKRAAGQALGIDINSQGGQAFVLTPPPAPAPQLANGAIVIGGVKRSLRREGQLPETTSPKGRQDGSLQNLLRTVSGLAARSKTSVPQLFWDGIQGAGRLKAATIQEMDPALFQRIQKASP